MTYGPPPGPPPQGPPPQGPPPQGPPPQGNPPQGNPPPQPGYGPPPGGGYGAPQGGYAPPGQYGPPPGQYPPRKSGVDLAAVNPLDWAAIGAGVLALIFSFFSYYSYSYKSQFAVECGNDCSRNTGAWSGFFGWFAVLLALAAAALIAATVFAPQAKMPFQARLVALACFAVGVLFTLLALAVVPDYNGGGSGYDKVINEGHSFSYWIVLVLLVVGTVTTFLRFQQTGGNLAALMPKKKAAPAQQGYGSAAPGYQQPPQFPPPAQPYQQPTYPPPPAYQPPPGSQPGYQPPPAGYTPPPPQPAPPSPPQAPPAPPEQPPANS